MESSDLLQMLGLDEAGLLEAVAERVAHRILVGGYDQDDEDRDCETAESARELKNELKQMAAKVMADKVDQIAARAVSPMISEMAEKLVLQTTNAWGEKRGEPMSLTEFCVKRAEEWMAELVSNKGQTAAESRDGYRWEKYCTRAEWMVGQQIRKQVDEALKAVAGEANGAVIEGLKAHLAAKLTELREELVIEVRVASDKPKTA